jgi:hypothetical protein
MRKLIIPGVLALALTGASTIAMAQTQTDANKSEQTQSQKMKKKETTALGTEKLVVTAAQAEEWVGKRVYSDNDEDIGEIAAFKAGDDGNVQYFHTDIGGFLGIGETSVQVKPDQFAMRGDKLYLNISKEEAMKLPRVKSN